MEMDPTRPSLIPSKSKYSEGESTGRLVRLPRRDSSIESEPTTITTVRGDTADTME